MPDRLPRRGEIVELLIDAIAPNGKGKGHCPALVDNKLSFFVPGTAPGDVVRARVTGGQKRYVEADLIEVVTSSPLRLAPACPHYDLCGGCQLMHLDYAAQLEAKREMVRYALGRRHLVRETVAPAVASPRRLRYRVRSRLTLTDERRPGLLAWRSHVAIPIETCPQMHQELERGLLAALAEEHGWLVGTSITGVLDQETHRVWVQASDEKRSPGPEGWVVADRPMGAPPDDPLCQLRVAGFALEYAPDCFTQVNPSANELLVEHVVAALAAENCDRVLELYAGIGNFTLPIAARAQALTAVEWPRATHFARRNARRAGLANITHLGRDVNDALRILAGQGERFDLALLDPPREGLGAKGCNLLAQLGPRRVVYVSCDPDTLALDLEALTRQGYQLRRVVPFDMFPQTFHVEACAVMEKRAG